MTTWEVGDRVRLNLLRDKGYEGYTDDDPATKYHGAVGTVIGPHQHITIVRWDVESLPTNARPPARPSAYAKNEYLDPEQVIIEEGPV